MAFGWAEEVSSSADVWGGNRDTYRGDVWTGRSDSRDQGGHASSLQDCH